MPPYELCGSDTAIRYPGEVFYSTVDRIMENKQAIKKVRFVEDDFPIGSSKPAAIKLAEKKLTELAFRQTYLTKKDVESALGIDRPSNNENMIVWELQETKDTLEHVNPGTIDKIRFAIETAYDGAYTPDKRPYGLVPERMWTNGAYTTVEWTDGTKTTVKAENPETMTQYGGFCACLAKKLYGSTSNSIRHMQRAIDTVNWPARRKEIERKRLKEMRISCAEKKKLEFENKVKAEMEVLKAKREAERRLAQQGGDE